MEKAWYRMQSGNVAMERPCLDLVSLRTRASLHPAKKSLLHYDAFLPLTAPQLTTTCHPSLPRVPPQEGKTTSPEQDTVLAIGNGPYNPPCTTGLPLPLSPDLLLCIPLACDGCAAGAMHSSSRIARNGPQSRLPSRRPLVALAQPAHTHPPASRRPCIRPHTVSCNLYIWPSSSSIGPIPKVHVSVCVACVHERASEMDMVHAWRRAVRGSRTRRYVPGKLSQRRCAAASMLGLSMQREHQPSRIICGLQRD